MWKPKKNSEKAQKVCMVWAITFYFYERKIGWLWNCFFFSFPFALSIFQLFNIYFIWNVCAFTIFIFFFFALVVLFFVDMSYIFQLVLKPNETFTNAKVIVLKLPYEQNLIRINIKWSCVSMRYSMRSRLRSRTHDQPKRAFCYKWEFKRIKNRKKNWNPQWVEEDVVNAQHHFNKRKIKLTFFHCRLLFVLFDTHSKTYFFSASNFWLEQ